MLLLNEIVGIDKSEVLRYLGCVDGCVADEIHAGADAMIQHCLKTATPAYTYAYYKTKQVTGGVILSDTDVMLRGNDISNHLSNCKYCAVIAVTCGMGVERELTRLQRVSMSDAVVYDACSNAYTESMANYVESLIADEASKQGLRINYRYSPGYGDFPLDTQHDIIRILHGNKTLGLTVTDSGLLVPHKSVTAVIGIFDKFVNIEQSHGCDNCGMKDTCRNRKVMK